MIYQTDQVSDKELHCIVDLLPGEKRRVAVRHNLDDLSINRESSVSRRLHISVEDSESRVVFKEMRSLLDTAGVVNGNDIKRRVLTAVPASQEVPPDPTESIDGHLKFSLGHTFPVSTTASHLATCTEKHLNGLQNIETDAGLVAEHVRSINIHSVS